MAAPLTPEAATAFGADWIAAWNAHDLERVLVHYAEDVEFLSPFAREFAGGGTVRGKSALRAYWARALAALPDLRFELIAAVPGVDSLCLVYVSVRDLLAVEHMVFDAGGLIVSARCHYRPRETA